MNKNPLVSILVANYNNGPYLEECIESIVNQTYRNIEILIRDDASTDNSMDVIKMLANKYSNIKTFQNKGNKKVAYTFRTLIEDSEGELCAMVGGDDTIDKNAVKILVEKHVENLSKSIVYSTHYLCDSDLNVIKISPYPRAIPEGENHMTCPGISSLAMFKKENYNRTEGISDDFHVAVDQDFYFKMEETGNTLFVNLPLYYYRRHNKSVSNDHVKAFKYHLMAIERAIKRRKKTFEQNNVKYLNTLDLNVLKNRFKKQSKFKKIFNGYYLVQIKYIFRQRKYIWKEFKELIHRYKF